MGEGRKEPVWVGFDSRLRLESHGARVTSNAGLLAYRELDEQLGLTALAAEKLIDPRHDRNTQHGMVALVRQGVYGRLAGYEDTNAAKRSTDEMGRLETEPLAIPENG